MRGLTFRERFSFKSVALLESASTIRAYRWTLRALPAEAFHKPSLRTTLQVEQPGTSEAPTTATAVAAENFLSTTPPLAARQNSRLTAPLVSSESIRLRRAVSWTFPDPATFLSRCTMA